MNPSISVDHRELNRRGPIATVTMHFMGELNILGRAEMTAFIEAFHALAEDDTLRAVVLRGAGERAFIGGANIKEMAALDPGSAKAFITLLHEMNAALRALPVPVIAQIRGYCLGGGMEVGAACDIRVSADDATFGMPEVRVGIPSVIEAALLPPLIGWGKTREVLYTGGMYSAAEMHACGFLERCVPANEVDAITDHLLDGILQSGPNAIRTQKALMREWEKVSPEEAVHRGIAAFAASYETDEPTRAMRAFLDRKRPG